MQHYDAFYQGLHCLLKYTFWGFHYTRILNGYVHLSCGKLLSFVMNTNFYCVTFEKFECNYRCTINSMNSVFMAENANGPWTVLSDSMYQIPKKKKIPTYRISD